MSVPHNSFLLFADKKFSDKVRYDLMESFMIGRISVFWKIDDNVSFSDLVFSTTIEMMLDTFIRNGTCLTEIPLIQLNSMLLVFEHSEWYAQIY